MRSDLDTHVSALELSEFLDLGVARVHKMTAQGILQSEEGRYHLPSTVKAYVARLRESAKGRLSAKDITVTDDNEDPDAVTSKLLDPVQEGARLKKTQADLNELKLAQARGQVLPMEAALIVWGRLISATRSELLGLASALPTKIHGLTRAEVEIIENDVRESLERLVASGESMPEEIKNMALDDEK